MDSIPTIGELIDAEERVRNERPIVNQFIIHPTFPSKRMMVIDQLEQEILFKTEIASVLSYEAPEIITVAMFMIRENKKVPANVAYKRFEAFQKNDPTERVYSDNPQPYQPYILHPQRAIVFMTTRTHLPMITNLRTDVFLYPLFQNASVIGVYSFSKADKVQLWDQTNLNIVFTWTMDNKTSGVSEVPICLYEYVQPDSPLPYFTPCQLNKLIEKLFSLVGRIDAKHWCLPHLKGVFILNPKVVGDENNDDIVIRLCPYSTGVYDESYYTMPRDQIAMRGLAKIILSLLVQSTLSMDYVNDDDLYNSKLVFLKTKLYEASKKHPGLVEMFEDFWKLSNVTPDLRLIEETSSNHSLTETVNRDLNIFERIIENDEAFQRHFDVISWNEMSKSTDQYLFLKSRSIFTWFSMKDKKMLGEQDIPLALEMMTCDNSGSVLVRLLDFLNRPMNASIQYALKFFIKSFGLFMPPYSDLIEKDVNPLTWRRLKIMYLILKHVEVTRHYEILREVQDAAMSSPSPLQTIMEEYLNTERISVPWNIFKNILEIVAMCSIQRYTILWHMNGERIKNLINSFFTESVIWEDTPDAINSTVLPLIAICRDSLWTKANKYIANDYAKMRLQIQNSTLSVDSFILYQWVKMSDDEFIEKVMPLWNTRVGMNSETIVQMGYKLTESFNNALEKYMSSERLNGNVWYSKMKTILEWMVDMAWNGPAQVAHASMESQLYAYKAASYFKRHFQPAFYQQQYPSLKEYGVQDLTQNVYENSDNTIISTLPVIKVENVSNLPWISNTRIIEMTKDIYETTSLLNPLYRQQYSRVFKRPLVPSDLRRLERNDPSISEEASTHEPYLPQISENNDVYDFKFVIPSSYRDEISSTSTGKNGSISVIPKVEIRKKKPFYEGIYPVTLQGHMLTSHVEGRKEIINNAFRVKITKTLDSSINIVIGLFWSAGVSNSDRPSSSSSSSSFKSETYDENTIPGHAENSIGFNLVNGYVSFVDESGFITQYQYFNPGSCLDEIIILLYDDSVALMQNGNVYPIIRNVGINNRAFPHFDALIRIDSNDIDLDYEILHLSNHNDDLKRKCPHVIINESPYSSPNLSLDGLKRGNHQYENLPQDLKTLVDRINLSLVPCNGFCKFTESILNGISEE